MLRISLGDGVSQVDRVVGKESVPDPERGAGGSRDFPIVSPPNGLLMDRFSGQPVLRLLVRIGLKRLGAMKSGGHEV